MILYTKLRKQNCRDTTIFNYSDTLEAFKIGKGELSKNITMEKQNKSILKLYKSIFWGIARSNTTQLSVGKSYAYFT